LVTPLVSVTIWRAAPKLLHGNTESFWDVAINFTNVLLSGEVKNAISRSKGNDSAVYTVFDNDCIATLFTY
jgi:hypothetical protein